MVGIWQTLPERIANYRASSVGVHGGGLSLASDSEGLPLFKESMAFSSPHFCSFRISILGARGGWLVGIQEFSFLFLTTPEGSHF